ncbi:hypothetical protein FGO68_gene5015 [Halteria grandinella]|uniref:Uncharacterized protein n=1 Tax=Halteria grandinella TaxID=5974 RepID=A0A8J8NAZ7_HALGN|nr:hypothetical protein FGO68_gene5015 [Halteria grandinella]
MNFGQANMNLAQYPYPYSTKSESSSGQLTSFFLTGSSVVQSEGCFLLTVSSSSSESDELANAEALTG